MGGRFGGHKPNLQVVAAFGLFATSTGYLLLFRYIQNRIAQFDFAIRTIQDDDVIRSRNPMKPEGCLQNIGQLTVVEGLIQPDQERVGIGLLDG